MGYKERVLRYYGASKDPNLLLQLLGNSYGNTNALWVDTSMYATNAVQSQTPLYVPTLTADKFGTGKYGYVFNRSEGDHLFVSDSSRFSFSDNISDLPFTVKYKYIHVSDGTLIAKQTVNTTDQEWTVWIQSGVIYFLLWSSSSAYIGIGKSFTFVSNQIYDIKLTYDGSGSRNGVSLIIDSVNQAVTRYNSGVYVKMRQTNAQLTIAQGIYGAMNGALTDIEIWKGVI